MNKMYKSLLVFIGIIFVLTPYHNVCVENYREFTNNQEATDCGSKYSENYLFSNEERKTFKDYSVNSKSFNNNLRKGIDFANLDLEEQS